MSLLWRFWSDLQAVELRVEPGWTVAWWVWLGLRALGLDLI